MSHESTPGDNPEGTPFDLFHLPVDDDQAEGLDATAAFERFHGNNPHFYTALVNLARRFQAKTGRACGIQRLIEIARWDIEMTLVGDDEFKVNNNYAPYYARLIMLQEEDLRGFFKLRRADEADLWAAALDTGRAA